MQLKHDGPDFHSEVGSVRRSSRRPKYLSSLVYLRTAISLPPVPFDFHATLQLTVSQGQQGPSAEMSYHQAVTKQVTAGGSVAASLGKLLPIPDVRQLGWGAFGSWHDLKRDNYVLGRYDSQSGALACLHTCEMDFRDGALRGEAITRAEPSLVLYLLFPSLPFVCLP